MKISTADSGKTVTLPNVSNVEIIELQGSSTAAATTTINTTTLSGVTNLNVTKMGQALAATAAATTDVLVEMKATNQAVGVDGGKDVTVKLADVTGASDVVTIGAGTTKAAGNVVVEMTGAKVVAAAGAVAGSAVNVTGGKTISVTQKATSDASAAATDKSAGGTVITQGAVNVTGNANTTTVTVKQDVAQARVQAVDAVAAKATTKEVVFSAAKKGDVVTIDFGAGSLAFTANKDLTAAEVASAFANLAKNVKQGNAAASFGIYTDANADAGATTSTGVTNNWTSGAVQTVSATQSKIVFSSTTKLADLSVAVTPVAGSTFAATAQNLVVGETAVTAKTGVLGVANGVVNIQDSGAGSIKTITVDGYANTSAIGTTGATAVLETLNLSNAEGAALMTVADTAATLALTLEKMGSSVTNAQTGVVTNTKAVLDFTAAPTTLNVKSVGNNRIDLDAVATETLNVSGTGSLTVDERAANELTGLKTIKVTETAGLTLSALGTNNITSVDTTGTTGTVSVQIKGDAATYTGGAGVDNVTVINANTAIAKAIDLGAGNDILTLNVTAGTVAMPTVELKGGEGNDTIAMSAADAIALSANATFEAKITSFEKLNLNTTAAAVGTVDLANLDDINYVISANSAPTATAAKAVYAGAVAGLTQNDTIKFTYNGGAESTATIGVIAGATATAAEVQAAINAAVGAGKVVASFSGADLILTAAGNVVTDTLLGGAYADVNGAVPDRSVADATDTAVAGTPAKAVYGGAVTYMTTTDTIKFTYAGGAELTATIGAIAGATATVGEVQTAINTALVAAGFANGDVVATFAVADLTLTAKDTRALVGGAYADTDNTQGAGAGNVADAVDTAGSLVPAKAVYTAAAAGLTANDTIKLTYAGGAELTATIGATAGATATVGEVQTAINTALVAAGFANGDVVASLTADLTLTAKDTRALVGGAYADVDGAIADRSVADAVDTAAGAATPMLTLDKMASNGTLELTAAGAGVIVNVTDATTGLTDILNIVTNATTGANLGTVQAAKVETIYVTANDTDLLKTSGVDNVSTNTLKLDVNGAKTVNLNGAGNLVLTFSTDTKDLTLIDGTDATGKLNVTTQASDTAATTVKGGSAADTLVAQGANDVLIGNAGNDILKVVGNVASAVSLTGGDGVDQFDVSGFTAANAGAAATIADLAKGETIKFVTDADANFASSKVTLIAEATFDNYVTEAAKAADAASAGDHGIAWFQFGNNTFIVQDVDGNAVFDNGVDIIVKLTGTVDLSASSFNEVGQGTLLYI